MNALQVTTATRPAAEKLQASLSRGLADERRWGAKVWMSFAPKGAVVDASRLFINVKVTARVWNYRPKRRTAETLSDKWASDRHSGLGTSTTQSYWKPLLGTRHAVRSEVRVLKII
jgi:hypothetical protein